jgi:hypothetical protein
LVVRRLNAGPPERIVAVCQCHHCEIPYILGLGAEVRRQKRFMPARVMSAVLVERKYFGSGVGGLHIGRPVGPHARSRGRAPRHALSSAPRQAARRGWVYDLAAPLYDGPSL